MTGRRFPPPWNMRRRRLPHRERTKTGGVRFVAILARDRYRRSPISGNYKENSRAFFRSPKITVRLCIFTEDFEAAKTGAVHYCARGYIRRNAARHVTRLPHAEFETELECLRATAGDRCSDGGVRLFLDGFVRMIFCCFSPVIVWCGKADTRWSGGTGMRSAPSSSMSSDLALLCRISAEARRVSPPTSPSCRSCCGRRRLFEHFRFSSNSGHIAAPHEPTQWAKRRRHHRRPGIPNPPDRGTFA